MHASLRNLRSFPALWPAVLLLAGCGTTTLTPTFPVLNNLPRPDRILVYDFAVSPSSLEAKGGPDADARGGFGVDAQTQEDIRVGNMFAKDLTDSLVAELRSRGIDAYRGADAAPPGPDTALIKGRFLRTSLRDGSTVSGFGLSDGRVRAQVQIFQGAGLNSSLVSEGQISTPSNLSPGIEKSGNAAVSPIVQADAKRTAAEIAGKIADYYQRQGWIKM
jgi:hypothetical protein